MFTKVDKRKILKSAHTIIFQGIINLSIRKNILKGNQYSKKNWIVKKTNISYLLNNSKKNSISFYLLSYVITNMQSFFLWKLQLIWFFL